MLIQMRTTLVLEDTVFEKAKRRAAEINMTLSELTSLALKTLLMKQASVKKNPPIKLPTYGVKGKKVDFSPIALAALRDEGR